MAATATTATLPAAVRATAPTTRATAPATRATAPASTRQRRAVVVPVRENRKPACTIIHQHGSIATAATHHRGKHSGLHLQDLLLLVVGEDSSGITLHNLTTRNT
jgi:hypothetical protein